MSINRHSVIFNLMLFLSLFFIAVIFFFALANATVTKQNLKASEEEKIRTVVNTILPVISINLSFGFEESVRELLDSLPAGNNNILGAQIIDRHGNELYAKYLSPEYGALFPEKEARFFYHSSPILDPVTQEKLGTLNIAYSNRYYQKILGEYQKFLMMTIIPTMAAFILFALFFYRKLRPLKTLSKRLEAYRPGSGDADLAEIPGYDEIAVINNSAARMVAKIKEYTDTLNDLNANLEKKIKKEVEKNREKDQILIRQSRQAALGEMIGNIAHQWRQPINSLGLIIQDIEEAHEHNELDAVYIDKAINQSMELITHMSDTIDDFRNFFLPNKDKSYFLISEAVDNALNIIGAALAHADIRVHKTLAPNMHIYTFKNELTQVIINILNNSKDAFKAVESEDKQILIEALPDEEHQAYILTLTDNAGGIDTAIIDKIFDPYFTTKHKDQGTGIGLYMAKSIIENNMGGRLEATNVDHGVRLCITLPFDAVRMSIEQ